MSQRPQPRFAEVLRRDGYVEGCAYLTKESAVEYFSRWGRVVASSRHPELVRDIRPQPAREAPTNTLSSRHGFGAFPFHSDGAHWRQPPRYLVLYCVAPGMARRETLLTFPLDHMGTSEALILKRGLWRVYGVREPFSARILDGIGGKEFLRFDDACMKPVDSACESAEVLRQCIARSPEIRISWEHSKFLIIDNWRVLHARGAAQQIDVDRHHWRLLLE